MKQVLIDPKVSRRKFNKEVKSLLNLKDDLRKRGWIIENIDYPIVRVTFLAIGVTPPMAFLTVDIDFANYNICAPSVRFLHPVTFAPLYVNAIRKLATGESRNLMINAHPDTKESFLCLPGIYEYHIHPEHDGDSWDIHRYSGEGTLYFILENIWKYCIKGISTYLLQIQLQLPQIGVSQEAVE
jgi:hypothetical protein